MGAAAAMIVLMEAQRMGAISTGGPPPDNDPDPFEMLVGILMVGLIIAIVIIFGAMIVGMSQ
jgi:hypothetical protein